MLRRLAVGAAQHEAPVGPVRERRPHLLPADHPLVAVALGAGLRRWRGRSPRSARSSPGTRSRCRARIPGRKRRFCASSPKWTIVGPSRPSPTMPTRPGPPRARVLLVEDHLLDQRQAAAAVLLRPAEADPARARRARAPTRARSSNSSCSSPGPPRPRTTANSPSSRSASQSRASRRNASSSSEKRRSIRVCERTPAATKHLRCRDGRVPERRRAARRRRERTSGSASGWRSPRSA